MTDITSKISTLRKATATATVVVSKQETIDAIKNKQVPKGDIFEFSRAAGLLGIKKTSDLIPDCHPIPIEFAGIQFSLEGLSILITVEVHTVYKTGVEVEAMHGASVVALTIYDMLKPIDKGVEIQNIKLINKTGGKSGYDGQLSRPLKTAVIVCSDRISSGEKQDVAGKTIIEKLHKFNIENISYDIIPDEISAIQEKVKILSSEKYDLVLFTGGTGLSPRDVTPDAIKPLIEREIPGIMEAARVYGQERTPYAMLSRGIAGFIGTTLVLTLPGSTKGAAECIDALFPAILHVFKVTEGKGHE